MSAPVSGVILAGGQSRRMDGIDKGLIELHGRPMIEWVMQRFAPQTRELLISANRSLQRYREYGHPVLNDEQAGYPGPLAGMLRALREAEQPLLATAPCDSPFLPTDLVERLYQALEADDADISVAHDGERVQPVFALMRVRLADHLQDYLAGGERKIDRWYSHHRMVTADFSDVAEAFYNVNSPEQRQRAARVLDGDPPASTRGVAS